VRTATVVLLCVLFVAAAVVWAFGRTLIRPAAIDALPTPSAAAAIAAGDAVQGLSCIQDALGGTQAFAAVASLRITSDTEPVATTGMRPIPAARTIRVVFPNRYKRIDVGRPPGSTSTLTAIAGFDGPAILSRPGQRDPASTMRAAHEDFADQMLMRFPRALDGIRLTSHTTRDAGQDRLAIDATGPDDFRATLLADARTCVPVALEYLTGKGANAETRVDLSGYRAFGGIRFPTRLATSRAGEPVMRETVSKIEVNPSNLAADFTSGQ
jgi:hypothetical protein